MYFAPPPQNEKYFGHFHVEERADGKLRITIDYSGPDSSGQIRNGLWTMDQAFADKIRSLDFIIPEDR